MIIRSLIIATFSLVLSTAVYGDENLKLKKIEKLLEITEYKKELEKQRDLSIKQVVQGFDGLGLSGKQKEEFSKEVPAIFREMMAYEKLTPHLVKVYNDNFTENEIDEIIAFNQTALGKKLREKSTIIAQANLQYFKEEFPKAMEKVKKLSLKVAEQEMSEKTGS